MALVFAVLPPLHGGLSQSQSSCSILPDFEEPMVQHKAEVPPVFLAYRQVTIDGVRIPLIQVASAVIQAL